MMRIALVDYGIGNVGSVANALQRTGAEPIIVSDGATLRELKLDGVVMPGVGAVGEALALLRRRGLEGALNAVVAGGGVPFLGICVGMQVMAETCEEFGEHEALGWIPGRVRRLVPEGSNVRLPHVGWNNITVLQSDSFLAEVRDEHLYFVHSYAIDCPAQFVVATADYAGPFTAAVQRGHMMGVQFHPEKSSVAGAAIMQAFLKRCAELVA